jgi:hypothetical protein
LNAFLSISLTPLGSLFGETAKLVFQWIFLFSVITYFVISQCIGLNLMPEAFLRRREQLLSNASGNTAISSSTTTKYYNNPFSPSSENLERLAANLMESVFFTKERIDDVLCPRPSNGFGNVLAAKRFIVPVYLAVWLIICISSHNLEVITSTLQIIFSGEIFIDWLKLELLRYRCQKIYDGLHLIFRLKFERGCTLPEADVLKYFVNYEAAKSSGGVWIYLPQDEFEQGPNKRLSAKWNSICADLGMIEKEQK